MTADDFKKQREQRISKDLEIIEDLVHDVFKQGCESGYQQGLNDAWDATRHIRPKYCPHCGARVTNK